MILLLKYKHLSIPFWGFVLWVLDSINRNFWGEYHQEGKKPLKNQANHKYDQKFQIGE